MPSSLWIDLEDLFLYGDYATRPTGIQRVVFEICTLLQSELGAAGRVHFVRHDADSRSFRVIPWEEVRRLIDRMTRPAVAAKPALVTDLPSDPRQQRLRQMSWPRRNAERLMGFLPPGYHGRLMTCIRFQYWTLVAILDLARFTRRDLGLRLRSRRWFQAVLAPLKSDSPAPAAFSAAVRPGDVLLMLGAPGSDPDFADLARRHQAEFGLRFALLFHDIIPIRRPEWFEAEPAAAFKTWYTRILPVLDHVFAVSHATARDVVGYARECGIRLRSDIRVVSLGTGFSRQGEADPAPDTARLPAAGSYVLFVSTVEVRKNHILLFRVWRRLLEEMPKDQVPTLVFAGSTGWLVRDLIEQMRNSNHLDGKLLHLQGLSDTELAALYRGCLFTVYPSLYEGWGLPVSESLAFGKPCLAASRSSIPEAGGTLVRYFDPEHTEEAYRTLRATIEDRPGLAVWEATIRREFRPVSWAGAAHQIIAELGASAEADPVTA